MQAQSFKVGPYSLTLYQQDDGNPDYPPPLIVCHYLDKPAELWKILDKNYRLPCHLAAIDGVTENEFLPYACPELGERFSIAHGPEYYQTLTTELIPALKAKLTEPVGEDPIIAGYSLAGLFALWAAAQPNSHFDQAISCSGSLWYPGAIAAITPPPYRYLTSVYLSVGVQEKNKGPEMFRAVEQRTREAYELYNNCSCCLKLNPGGHFDQVTERFAKGILWTLSEYY